VPQAFDAEVGMAWWLWAILGIALVAFEVHLPSGFYIFSFGVGGILVSALAGLGWVESPTLQWLLFTVFSLASLVTSRFWGTKRRPEPWRRDAEIPDMVGEVAVLSDDLAVGGTGKAELRGTVWTARNAATLPLSKGQRCRVARLEGLTLWVRAE
jgi:inner membrane protein